MQVYLPNELQDWLIKEKPSEGEILFMAIVSLFATMMKVKTFQEWESDDIKAILWDIETYQAQTELARFQEQGVLEVIKGLDGVESFRLHPHLKVNGTKLLSKYSNIAITLKETKSIYLLGYLLGRLAHIKENRIEEIVMNRYPSAVFIYKEKSKYYNRKEGSVRKEYKISAQQVIKDEIKRKTSSIVNVIPLIYMDTLTKNKIK